MYPNRIICIKQNDRQPSIIIFDVCGELPYSSIHLYTFSMPLSGTHAKSSRHPDTWVYSPCIQLNVSCSWLFHAESTWTAPHAVSKSSPETSWLFYFGQVLPMGMLEIK